MKLKVLSIIDGTTVDGPGFRTAIYFAGCAHGCPGCQNPQSWDFDAGNEMSIEQIMERVAANDIDVSLSGGDPLYQLDGIVALCRQIKAAGKDIWLYTGFTFESITADSRYAGLLGLVDVIVDGPFVENLRDRTLLFRGSSNQRLVDVAKSLGGKIVEWQPDF